MAPHDERPGAGSKCADVRSLALANDAGLVDVRFARPVGQHEPAVAGRQPAFFHAPPGSPATLGIDPETGA